MTATAPAELPAAPIEVDADRQRELDLDNMRSDIADAAGYPISLHSNLMARAIEDVRRELHYVRRMALRHGLAPDVVSGLDNQVAERLNYLSALACESFNVDALVDEISCAVVESDREGRIRWAARRGPEVNA